jgi:hypothetical protein
MQEGRFAVGVDRCPVRARKIAGPNETHFGSTARRVYFRNADMNRGICELSVQLLTTNDQERDEMKGHPPKLAATIEQ